MSYTLHFNETTVLNKLSSLAYRINDSDFCVSDTLYPASEARDEFLKRVLINTANNGCFVIVDEKQYPIIGNLIPVSPNKNTSEEALEGRFSNVLKTSNSGNEVDPRLLVRNFNSEFGYPVKLNTQRNNLLWGTEDNPIPHFLKIPNTNGGVFRTNVFLNAIDSFPHDYINAREESLKKESHHIYDVLVAASSLVISNLGERYNKGDFTGFIIDGFYDNRPLFSADMLFPDQLQREERRSLALITTELKNAMYPLTIDDLALTTTEQKNVMYPLTIADNDITAIIQPFRDHALALGSFILWSKDEVGHFPSLQELCIRGGVDPEYIRSTLKILQKVCKVNIRLKSIDEIDHTVEIIKLPE